MQRPASVVRGINHRLLIVIVLATFIIGLTMSAAIRRGMDHAVMIGQGDQTAIAIVLSDSVYKIRLGYVGLRQVFDTIQTYWNRDTNYWANTEQLKKNFHDAELLNAGIRAAASLGPQTPGYIHDGSRVWQPSSLITTYYDDMGEVDYVSLAFRLFGLKVQSMFYLYFTLLGLSALIFILTFHDRIFALCLLATTLFAYYVELYLSFFDPVAIVSYWGMRHSSTLCLVPMLHFAFLMVWRRKLTPAVAAGAVVQLFILILAWRIRGSVAWVLVFLPALAVVLAFWDTWPRSNEPGLRWWAAVRHRVASFPRSAVIFARSWRTLVRRTLCWPLVLVLLGVFANNLYNRATLHPIYYTDDVMPQHGIWHPVHLGIGIFIPDVLSPRIFNVLQTQGFTEELTLWGARDYLDRVHFIPWNGKHEHLPLAPGYLSPWHGLGLKINWQERLMRYMFWERLREHPLRFLEAYASMPAHVIRTLAAPFAQAPTLAWLWLVIAAGIAVFTILFALARREAIGDGFKVIGVGAAALAMATLPNMVSFYVAPYSMADSILMVMAFTAAAIGIGAYAVLRVWPERARE
jgi:hypothetical protein